MPNNLFAKLRVALAIVVSTAMICLAIEAGLQLRAWLDDLNRKSALTDSSKKRILMIGDSILGLPGREGIASQLSDQLEKIRPHTFSVINLDSPANTTNRVSLLIKDYLRVYRPSAIVFLLGKSDTPIASASLNARPTHDFNSLLQRSRLLKFLDFSQARLSSEISNAVSGSKILLGTLGQKTQGEVPSVSDFERLEGAKDYEALWSLVEKTANDPDSTLACYSLSERSFLSAYFNREDAEAARKQALDCSGNLSKTDAPKAVRSAIDSLIGTSYKTSGDFASAERLYRKAIETNPESSRPYSDLGWLYMAQDNCELAIPPLEKSIRLGRHWRPTLSALYKCYTKQGRSAEGREFFAEIYEGSAEPELLLLLEKMLGQKPSEISASFEALPASENHDQLLSRLWLYKKLKQPSQANALFLREKSTGEPLNESLFAEIIKVAASVPIVVLQYPTESDEPIQRSIALAGVDSHFLSLHDALARNLGSHDVFDFFEDDFEHLSPIGLQIITESLASKLAAIDTGD